MDKRLESFVSLLLHTLGVSLPVYVHSGVVVEGRYPGIV
jgi:hypothetical protein